MRLMNADVIIIGAGAAGLAAAERLSETDIKIMVLEARERVGGRIYTVDQNAAATGGAAVELGAEFVHGVAPEIFAISRRANLETIETTGKSWCVDQTNVLRLCDELPETGEDQIWQGLDLFDGADLSLESFVHKHFSAPQMSLAKASVLRYAAGFHAAETKRAGVAGIQRAERAAALIEGERAFRFPNGYNQIPEHLHAQCAARAVEFRLGCAVKTVRWQNGTVEIEVFEQSDDQTKIFKARRAVVALPLGVLKAEPAQTNRVLFEPALDAKKSALDKLEMGDAVRVVLRFRRDWWTKRLFGEDSAEKLGFLLAANQPFGAWWTNESLAAPVLTAWTGGDNAKIFEGCDADSIKNQAVESLSQIFKIEKTFVENELENWYFHDWRNDPFARGAYSYVGVGGIDAGMELARPLADTLFFAGEATDSDGYLGTVHGALASGVRAAQEVLKSF